MPSRRRPPLANDTEEGDQPLTCDGAPDPAAGPALLRAQRRRPPMDPRAGSPSGPLRPPKTQPPDATKTDQGARRARTQERPLAGGARRSAVAEERGSRHEVGKRMGWAGDGRAHTHARAAVFGVRAGRTLRAPGLDLAQPASAAEPRARLGAQRSTTRRAGQGRTGAWPARVYPHRCRPRAVSGAPGKEGTKTERAVCRGRRSRREADSRPSPSLALPVRTRRRGAGHAAGAEHGAAPPVHASPHLPAHAHTEAGMQTERKPRRTRTHTHTDAKDGARQRGTLSGPQRTGHFSGGEWGGEVHTQRLRRGNCSGASCRQLSDLWGGHVGRLGRARRPHDRGAFGASDWQASHMRIVGAHAPPLSLPSLPPSTANER